MKFSARHTALTLAVALACACSASFAADPGYPSRPIRMIVGFAPGGGTDSTARALTPKLSELLGQQVIVDNRPGASGNIATDIVTKAPADGYTILMGTIAALAINPTLYGNLPFDPLKDLAPVIRVADSTNILVVHPSVPAKTVKDLIALAKAKPLNIGSSGVGGTGHLALELFNVSAGTKMTHVPYKGGGPAMTDLLGGQINGIFATAASAVPHIQSGKINALAVTTAKRSELVPNLPTVAEAGLPGFEANNWNALMVPARTPKAVIDKLNKQFTVALNTPDVKQILFKQGLDVAPGTPESLSAYIKTETAKWAKVIKASGAKPE